MSCSENSFGPWGPNRRFTSSADLESDCRDMVQRFLARRRVTPASPVCHINRPIRLWLTCRPHSSATPQQSVGVRRLRNLDQLRSVRPEPIANVSDEQRDDGNPVVDFCSPALNPKQDPTFFKVDVRLQGPTQEVPNHLEDCRDLHNCSLPTLTGGISHLIKGRG
jgi:hypothetical protein